MTKKQAIKLFEEKKVRTVWDDLQEKWYFSIVDVCGVLTDSKDATTYWRKLKQRPFRLYQDYEKTRPHAC